jgi:hypothetical protein
MHQDWTWRGAIPTGTTFDRSRSPFTVMARPDRATALNIVLTQVARLMPASAKAGAGPTCDGTEPIFRLVGIIAVLASRTRFELVLPP